MFYFGFVKIKNLFNPNVVNFLLSAESKYGNTPITAHLRMNSYERFIHMSISKS